MPAKDSTIEEETRDLRPAESRGETEEGIVFSPVNFERAATGLENLHFDNLSRCFRRGEVPFSVVAAEGETVVYPAIRRHRVYTQPLVPMFRTRARIRANGYYHFCATTRLNKREHREEKRAGRE